MSLAPNGAIKSQDDDLETSPEGQSDHQDEAISEKGHSGRPDDSTSIESHKSETDLSPRSSSSSDLERGPDPRLSRTVSDCHDGIHTRRTVSLREDGDEEPQGLTTAAPSIRSNTRSATVPSDPNLVTFSPSGPGPTDPKTWHKHKKWAAVVAVSLFTFISPVASTMIAPALPALTADLSIPPASTEAYMTLSIFILGYAVAPLFLGPLSEVYGRVPVLQLSNLVFLFFNLGCGLSKTKGQLMAFRFLSGLGGSAPLAIGAGVIGDLFTAEQRGRAIAVYSLCPLLGPAIGPMAGGFITQYADWRWVFHATTIADAVIQCIGLAFLRETYAPVLLAREKRRRAKGLGEDEAGRLRTPYEADGSADMNISLARRLGTAFVRPFRMIATQLIIQVLAGYLLFLYGTIYLVMSTFPNLWAAPPYNMDVGIGGLNYIAMGVGFFLGAQLLAPLQDMLYAALKRRAGTSVGRPEFRAPLIAPGAVLVPLGLLVYGWCAERKTHWIGPDFGVGLFTMGTIVGFQCVQGYLVDAYPRYAASAVAASTVLRSLGGFGFPLFAPALFARLGSGWGNTVLAAIAVVVGWPAPFLLWRYGEEWRRRSTFASGDKG